VAGEIVELNYIEVDSDLNDVFSKVSSFYKTSASADVFLPKKCEFLLKTTNAFGT
jgi:hypothetical protein